MSQQTFRSGPIPSPKEFEGYKRINPDFPERIFKQFEEDSETNRNLQKEAQAADIELDKERLKADIAFEKRSQWMAYTIMMLGLTGTFVLAYFDKDIPAIITGLSTAFLVFKGVFSKNQPPKKLEDDEKQTRDN